MKAILVQPPFVQLNTPYPAVHYLDTFLRARDVESLAFDHSIELYRILMSRAGLEPVFAAAGTALSRGATSSGAPLDRISRGELERYVSYEPLYMEWIEPLVDFLSGRDPGLAHRLGSAAELPRGRRAAAFLAERDGLARPDEAPALATRILDDLGDLVSFAFDPEFGTVRYAERLASSTADFESVRRALDASPLVSTHYLPYLRRFWSEEGRDADLVGISIPFPGCLVGALACARAAREALGPGARIVLGGGYVSTELRSLRDPGIFDFCDFLAFDAGYGALASILDVSSGAPDASLYRTMTRGPDGTIAAHGFSPAGSAGAEPPATVAATDEAGAASATTGPAEARYARLEKEAVRSTFPDYRGVDFGRYLRVVDSLNPMHRLWSDTPWLKYHLARGCYWRKCAFCDTELEYVADYSPSLVEPLMAAAGAASSATGLRGIHFVDEAMPMSSLLAFARANRARAMPGTAPGAPLEAAQADRARVAIPSPAPASPGPTRTSPGAAPFHFWGNIRFDASWTAGRCAFLAASGLVAVSGGIEIATERGLAMTDKGFDLAGLVRTLVALKRSGILVHAYLIYGFPGQPRQDIADSADFCRQLIAAGLVDSGFWHRFVLTRHSRMYAEWKAGARPSLVPVDAPRSFADNDLSFRGEDEFEPFDGPLASALAEWMSGEGLDRPFAMAAPPRKEILRSAIAPGLVETLIARAEKSLDAEPFPDRGRAYWIAGVPRRRGDAKGRHPASGTLEWAYRGEIERLPLDPDLADALLAAVLDLAGKPEGLPLADFTAACRAGLAPGRGVSLRAPLAALAGSGLAVV